jgi:hypothetical protein
VHVKKSRTLAVGIPFIIILICLTAYQYGYVKSMSDLASIRQEQASRMKMLKKYVDVISEKPALEKTIAALKEERKADNTKLIEGQTPSLAAAALQESVKDAITGKGGSISSERVGKPDDYGTFRIITVSIDATLPDVRALSDVLYSLETRTPYLVVKELDARVRNFREPKELMVKLDVSALTSAK